MSLKNTYNNDYYHHYDYVPKAPATAQKTATGSPSNVWPTLYPMR